MVRNADADRYVIPDPAVCIHSTQARTGVLTLATYARLVRWTVGIDDTLRTAVRRGADHVGKTVTLALLAKPSWCKTVGTARVRLARILLGDIRFGG